MNARVFIDGAVVDAADAKISVFDRGFLYGDSVYEVMRTVSTRAVGLEEHLERLEASAESLGITTPPRDDVRHAIDAVVRAVGVADVYLRVVVTRGAGEISLDPAQADAPRLIVIGKPVDLPDKTLYEQGAEIAIVGHSRSASGAVHPSVKSGNYLSSVLAVAVAKRRGAYEALLSDAAGRITEGASSNIFIVRGGEIVTPPVSAGILSGITRKIIIELARADGLSITEDALWPADVESADEAFITSSVRGVMPVVRVDGEPIGDGSPGTVTRRVMELYADFISRT